MNYIKAFSLFVISYLTLIFSGVFINSFFNITPQVGLNIIALIVTTFVVARFKYINFVKSELQLIFSLFGGGVTVVTAYILASTFSGFVQPSLVESGVVLIFNTLVIYITILIILKKNITRQ